jgi:hypothetical protein
MTGSHEVRGSIPLGSTKIQFPHVLSEARPRGGQLHQLVALVIAMHSPSKSPSLTLGLLKLSAKTKARARDWLIAFFLFAATAAVIIWQNARLAVLWDLSYVLENSYRIALGDILYRDFPFAHPPLTFLIQAAIIKLSGRVFWHSAAYCAIVGGLGTVLTWRILLHLLRDLRHARRLAFLLSLPLIVLGIYCVFPHPFYDPDCTFAILISVFLLLKMEGSSSAWAFLAGVSLVVPLFVKQNTGLVFLGSAVLALLVLIAIQIIRRQPFKRYVCALAGSLAALAFALLAIHLTAGLGNYWHWTIQFAAARRTPSFAEMIGIYRDKILWLWLTMLAVGAILWRFGAKHKRAVAIVSGLMLAAPFVWPAIYLLRDPDASERAERLIGVWPVLLIAAFVVAIFAIVRHANLRTALPFILIATINGAFMSQQLWGSTYAVWPLFIILLAWTMASLSERLAAGLVPQTVGRTSPPSKRSSENERWILLPATGLIVLSLVISGWAYVRSHERLDYANLSDGTLTRSALPQLKGLSARGDWLPSFEELVRYTEAKIPRAEGLLIIPGEDAFYFTTGRRPQFPVLQFDHTVNPYSPEEILQICRARDIRWLIVKQDLQDEDEQLEADRDRMVEVLETEYEQIESLKNYDIYRRIDPAKKAEEDQDSKPKR